MTDIGYPHIALNGNRALISRFGNDAESVAVYERDDEVGLWAEKSKLSPPLDKIGFARSLALGDGDAFIAAPNYGNNAGAVYVFDTSKWLPTILLTVPQPTNNDFFDEYMAHDGGDLAVIGARSDDDRAPASGAAYVFTRSSMLPKWGLAQKLTAADGDVGHAFGTTVCVSGRTITVASPFANNGTGTLYVFVAVANGTSFTEVQRLVLIGPAVDTAHFGEQHSLDGNTLVVGVARTNDGVGAVHVYERGDAADLFTRRQLLLPPTSVPNTFFGSLVALHGDTVLVASDTGENAVHVFQRLGTGWQAVQVLRPADGDFEFGASIAISGDTIMVAALVDDGTLQGVLYFWERAPTTSSNTTPATTASTASSTLPATAALTSATTSSSTSMPTTATAASLTNIDDEPLPLTLIAGAVGGGAFLLIALMCVLLCVVRGRRHRRRAHNVDATRLRRQHQKAPSRSTSRAHISTRHSSAGRRRQSGNYGRLPLSSASANPYAKGDIDGVPDAQAAGQAEGVYAEGDILIGTDLADTTYMRGEALLHAQLGGGAYQRGPIPQPTYVSGPLQR